MRLSPLLGALVATAAFAAPAFAAEPAEIVQQLYADHPHETDPPGGMDLWMPEMQARWQKLNEDEAKRIAGELDFLGEGLTFDFMTGTQEFWFDGLKVKTVIQTEGEADVLAVMNTGADVPFALHYGFVRDDTHGWQIAEVWREGGWRLSELIEETR